MSRPIRVAAHLTPEQLDGHYEAAEGVLKDHLLVIRLAIRERSSQQICETTTFSRDWVFEILRRYNQLGLAGLGDGRRNNVGRPTRMNDALDAELRAALAGPAPDEGPWTSRKVVAWLEERLEGKVDGLFAWRTVQRLGYRLQRPRPRHVAADAAAQEDFKRRGLQEAIAKVRADHPQAQVEVWAEDEARLGLKPIVRRVWAKKGQRPVAFQRPRYQWLYVYAFARPDSGEVFWLLLPSVSSELFSLALREFAADVEAGPDRHIVLVLDGAGWHTAKDLVVPDGIHLLFQPPHSPELQPCERLWVPLTEPLANRPFDDLDAMETVLHRRCLDLIGQPDLIRGHTLFHWWEAALGATL